MPRAESLELLFGRHAADLDHVALGDVRGGVGKLLHKGAVIGQQQQALAGVIKPADREDSLLDPFQQLHDRWPPLGIGDGSHVPFGLVERDVNVTLASAQQLAVHANLVCPRISLRSQLRDLLAVDADPSRCDQLFRLAPRGYAGGGKNLL